jgi:hypothetical protein
MSDMPRTLSPAGTVALGSTDRIGPFLRRLVAAWFRPAAETARLSSRSLAFEVRPLGTRLNLPGALYAFAYRNGGGWRVLYVGAQARHKIGTAIGYGATHVLVRRASEADEAWLIDELKPPLNGGWR